MLVQATSAFSIQFRTSLQLSPAGIALCNCEIPGVGYKGSIQRLPTGECHIVLRAVLPAESVVCLQMAQPTSDGMNGACKLDCAAIGDRLRAEIRRPYKSWRFLMPFDLCRRAQPAHLTSQKNTVLPSRTGGSVASSPLSVY